jgi:RsiW-degrading membrane proteinase PrsW (M82 family)
MSGYTGPTPHRREDARPAPVPLRRGRALRARVLAALQRPWLQIVIVGTLLFVVLTRATIDTQNINLVPSVIVLGSFLIPLAFVMYVYEWATEVPLTVVLGCFVTGGILGVTAASVLEYRTVLEVGALPTIAIGLSEESAKLVIPLVIFATGLYRREADGLLFGVASGMGFAAFETMGYGLTALLLSHGHIGYVEQLLFVRGLLAPAGHAAWTGLICAALWHAREHPGVNSAVAVVAAFVVAVLLHALWDSVSSVRAEALVGAVGIALLTWRIQVAKRDVVREGRALEPSNEVA